MLPGRGLRVFRLYKSLTTMGRGEENDIVIADARLADAHAHLRFDGRDFEITSLDDDGDLFVNGKRRKKQRLLHEDVVRVGATELIFSIFDEGGAAPIDDEAEERIAIAAYRKLHEFSERLLEQTKVGEVLERLMDAVVDITRADKGFLLLLEGGTPAVKVARNLKRENLVDAGGQLSDSIVEKVMKTRRPVIVSDALHDDEFGTAMSVMNMKLNSVMCVPLLERGNLLGAIYVGNDAVTHLFEEGALEVLTIFASQASLILRNALLLDELKLESRTLAAELEKTRFGEIVGSCTAMQDVYRKVTKIATTDISVLITGETGTGKELIAREIHRRSSRAKGPFITINCGAIPENLLESELFGHVRGAFTGAVANKAGRFQAADGGTLFLDEIGEMPLALQVKLLRALQERVVFRVGDNRPEPVDIRVLAATNRDLDKEIKAGRFREDLYYRLNVVQVHLPPLRERGDDVTVLARYLLGRYTDEFRSPVKGFSPDAAVALKRYPWPGNIRQLENALKKAVVLADKALLGVDDLGLPVETLPEILPLADAKERFQRDYINEVLERNAGNRTKTARDLGVDPRTIFRHLEKEPGDEEPPDGA
jgi:transcriptional regulator with GAF, ATPase, and Fis domain